MVMRTVNNKLNSGIINHTPITNFAGDIAKFKNMLEAFEDEAPENSNAMDQPDGFASHEEDHDDTNNDDNIEDNSSDDSQTNDHFELAQSISGAVSKDGNDKSPERISSIIDKYLQQNNLEIVKSQPGLADKEGNI